MTLSNVARAHDPQTSSAPFPTLAADGNQVRAKDHVASGTGLLLAIGYGLLAVLVLASLGTLLFLFGIGILVERFMSKRTMARVRGSSVQVNPAQLPEIHACIAKFSARLGLAEAPEVYVLESSELNAFSIRVGARKSVLLLDDLIWGSVEYGLTDALRFVIAHELAHHALGHTGAVRTALKGSIPKLARLDELSSDAVALQLVGSREAAYEGLMMLTTGPQLLRFVNRAELLRQAASVGSDKHALKAERVLTHPLLLRRIDVLRNVRLG